MRDVRECQLGSGAKVKLMGVGGGGGEQQRRVVTAMVRWIGLDWIGLDCQPQPNQLAGLDSINRPSHHAGLTNGEAAAGKRPGWREREDEVQVAS